MAPHGLAATRGAKIVSAASGQYSTSRGRIAAAAAAGDGNVTRDGFGHETKEAGISDVKAVDGACPFESSFSKEE
jgi:hypothetical protein